ncbi:MAG: AEC family transporter [Arenicellales bacterium]
MQILDTLLPLYFLISLGFWFKKSQFLSQTFWDDVEKLVYFILIPALIFAHLSRADINANLIGYILLAVALPTFIIGASQWLGFLDKRVQPDTFTSMFQGAVRNNTIIGLAIAGLVAPDNGVAIMALIMTIMVIINNISCVSVLSKYGDASKRAKSMQGKSVLRNVATNPLIQASIAGLAVNFLSITLPDAIHNTFHFLGKTGLPLALLAVGAGLSLRMEKGKTTALVLPVMAKLVLMPIIIYAVIYLMNGAIPNASIFILYGALPTAMSSYVLASQMGGDKQTMAQIITLQTLGAAFTLPVALWFIQQYM